MNLVILQGNVGSDPEFRYLENGSRVATFNLATNEYWTSGDDKHQKTTWHSVRAWGATADLVNNHVKKGAKVLVQGSIHVNKTEAREYTTIKVDKIEFL